MLYRLLICICLLLPTSVCAQQYIDLLTVNSYLSPNNSFKTGEGQVDVQQDYIGTRLPLVRKNGDVLLLTPYYTRLKLTTTGDSISNKAIFHQIGLPIGYQKHLSDKWQLLAMVIPRISSNFKDNNLDGDDVLYGGLLLATHKKRPGLTYKYGVYYGQEFFGPMIVPIFGLDWKMSEKWRFFGNLPIRGTLQYQAHPRFATGLNFVASVTSFRMSEAEAGQYLHKSNNELFLFADWYIAKKVVLRAEVGRAVARSYRTFSRNDQLDTSISLFKFGERQQLNRDLNDGNVFGLSLFYRFPLKE